MNDPWNERWVLASFPVSQSWHYPVEHLFFLIIIIIIIIIYSAKNKDNTHTWLVKNKIIKTMRNMISGGGGMKGLIDGKRKGRKVQWGKGKGEGNPF